MEQPPQRNDNNDILELIDVIDEDMGKSHILCLPDKKDRFRLVCSSFLSVFFHIGVYMALAYAAVTYPVIYTSSEQEIIWFYPSVRSDSQQPSDSETKSGAISKESRVSTDDRIVHKPSPALTEEAQPTTEEKGISFYTPYIPPGKVNKPPLQNKLVTPTPVVAAREQPHIATPEKSTLPQIDSIPPPQPAVPSQQIAAAEKQVESAKIEEKIIGAPAKPVFDNNTVRTSAKVPVAVVKPVKVSEVRQPAQPVRPEHKIVRQEQPVIVVKKIVAELDRKVAVQQKTVEVVNRKPSEVVKPAQVVPLKPTPLPSPKVLAVSQSIPKPSNGLSNNTAKPVIKAENDKHKEKVAPTTEKKQKVLIIPPLPGDLKFEITSDEKIQRGVRVTVLFRDFPKARRSRAISKSEASRIKTLTPKIVLTRPNTIQAIVETAAEGVYLLRVELDNLESIQAAITIRLFETGPRSRTKSLGRQKISSNETIVRILMPEGILWEDNSAFSGSMEDSNSVTKYNNETGLVWKE